MGAKVVILPFSTKFVTIQQVLYIRTQRHKETKILFRYKDNKRLESRHKGLQRENYVDFVSSFAAHCIFIQRKTLCIFVSLCLKLFQLDSYLMKGNEWLLAFSLCVKRRYCSVVVSLRLRFSVRRLLTYIRKLRTYIRKLLTYIRSLLTNKA